KRGSGWPGGWGRTLPAGMGIGPTPQPKPNSPAKPDLAEAIDCGRGSSAVKVKSRQSFFNSNGRTRHDAERVISGAGGSWRPVCGSGVSGDAAGIRPAGGE